LNHITQTRLTALTRRGFRKIIWRSV